jgi:GNAT superfamily N-acetyltransferase
MDIQIQHSGNNYSWYIGESYWDQYTNRKGFRRIGLIHTTIRRTELHIQDFIISDESMRGYGTGTQLLTYVLDCVAKYRQLSNIKYITGWLSDADNIDRNKRFYAKFGLHPMQMNGKWFIFKKIDSRTINQAS